MEHDRIVVVGRIGSAYGIKGWAHVHSFTDPVTNLLEFDQLYGRREGESWRQLENTEFRRHRAELIGRIEGCEDRTNAEELRNLELGVRRDALPTLQENEFYWVDLIGLNVVNTDGITLGSVSNVFETGATAVLDVKSKNGNYLIPLVQPILDSVSLTSHVKVQWDQDWRS